MKKIIDIITVNFNDEVHINLNIQNYNKINNYDFNWYIGDNSSSFINEKNESLYLFKGLDYKIFDHPALHHTHTLNKLYQNTKSDIVIVTDPDFYIYDLNQLKEVIYNVISNDIFIYGVPWHPKWVRKYQNFPAIHFMIINKNATTYDESLIDFRPSKVNFNFSKKIFQNSKKTFLYRLLYFIYRNKVFYNDGDTGSRLYFHRSIINFKIFKVLIQKNENFLGWNNTFISYFDYFFKNKYIPIKYSYVINYFINQNCEFFIFNNKIFGFHFRGNPKKNRNKTLEIIDAKLILQKNLDV